MDQAGFNYDDRGSLKWLDGTAIEEAGELQTYGGLNSQPYAMMSLPHREGEYLGGVDMLDPALDALFERLLPVNRMEVNEAALVMLELPDPCRYFGIQGYRPVEFDRVTGMHKLGLRHLHDGLNLYRINADPNVDGTYFGRTAVVIFTANRVLARQLERVLAAGGIPAQWINTLSIPNFVINLGLQRESDLLSLVMRVAYPENQPAFDENYRPNTPAIVARIWPKPEEPGTPVVRFGPPTFLEPGRGSGEDTHQATVDTMVAKIRAHHEAQGYEVHVFPIVQRNYIGLDRSDHVGILGPASSSDCCYGATAPVEIDVVPGTFCVTVDVNHKATDLAAYNNLVPYSVPKAVGAASVNDQDYSPRFASWATEWYLNQTRTTDPNFRENARRYLGVVRWAREETRLPGPVPVVLPETWDADPAQPGVVDAYPRNYPILFGTRAYGDRVTTTAPKAEELVDTILLVVRPKRIVAGR